MQYMVTMILIVCSMMLAVVDPAQAVVEQGRVGYWSFDACDARDDSGNGNGGTLVRNVSCVEGMFGMALAFGGQDDHVVFPRFSPPRNAFTFALWFRPSRNLNSGRDRQDLLFGQAGNSDDRPHISFNRGGEGRLALHVRIDGTGHNDVFTNTRSWRANTWQHLAFTWNGDRFRIYVNGEQERSVRHAGRSSTYNGFVIGVRHHDLRFDFEGSLDELAIYNRALSADEVKLLVMPKPPTPPPEPSPIGGIFCVYPLSQYFQLCE